nr:glycosyltransferase [Providencia rettgeri]
MNKITYSIITINYNNHDGLIKTTQSVIPLLNSGIEWIIIDGLSSDNSPDFIRNCSFANKYLIEKDNGIYDAMNKGIDIASGDFIIFMNSGDEFHPHFSFEKIDSILENKDISQCIIYGNTLRKLNHLFYLDEVNDSYDSWWEKVIPCHQSIIIPRNYMVQNKFDINYKIFADRINVQSAFYSLKTDININETISIYEVGGVSSIGAKTFSKLRVFINEFIDVNSRNLNTLSKVKLKTKLYFKYTIIRLIGYRLYYGLVYAIKSAKKK